MDILDRISMLLGDRDQKELTEYLGLKSAAFSEWKSGKSKSYKKYLIEIAEFFNISIDYLVYGSLVPAFKVDNSTVGIVGINSNGTVNMYAEEEVSEVSNLDSELLTIFHNLPLKEQHQFIVVAYEFEENYLKSKSNWKLQFV